MNLSAIENVARLLMYQGPNINDLIAEAYADSKEVKIDNIDASTVVRITFETAYKITVTDLFIFNEEKELIKQELHFNGRRKVVFDKYKEASELLNNLTIDELAAS